MEVNWLSLLCGILFVLIAFRRLIQRAVRQWFETEEPTYDPEFAEVVAREKSRMEEEAKDESIRGHE